jgi:hypothetical protein
MTDVTLIPHGKSPAVLDVDTTAPLDQGGVTFDIPRAPRATPPPRPPQTQQQRRPPPSQPPPRPPPPPEEELHDFANPQKIESPGDEEEFDEEFEEEEEYDEQEEMPEMPDDYYHQDEEAYQPRAPMQPTPTPPFKTLEEERADLMYKVHRASKNGITVRSFGWDTDIREIRAEAERVKMEQEVDASVALQRQILMTICTGLEYVNQRYDYLDLELDGWSESIMEDLPRYDLIFEKLHKKHAGKVSLPVELQLIMMIGGSAMTYHMVNKGRRVRYDTPSKKSKKKSKKKRSRKRDDYDSDDSDASERSRMRRKYSKPAPSERKSPPPPGQREMKGPMGMGGMDMGMMGSLAGLGGGLGGLGGLGSMAAMSMLPQMPVPTMNMPQMTRNTIEPINNNSPMQSPPREQQQQQEQDRRVMEAPPVQEDPVADDDDDSESGGERLSDIPSEELNEMLEADMDAMRSPSPTPDENTKLIELDEEPTKGKKGKGKGGKKKNPPKNVVVI